MGYESIAHEAEGRKGYIVDNYCFSKIQQVGQKYRDKTTLASKTRFSRRFFIFKAGPFRYWWAITYSLVVDQPIRTQH